MNRFTLASACCLLLSVGVAASAQQFDQVIPITGSTTSGVITGETPAAVTIEVRGAKIEVPVNTIKRVTFGEDPTELKRGRDEIQAGNYGAGLDDLSKVAPASLTRGLVKQDYAFYRALAMGRMALSGGGDKKAAADAMLNFVGAARSTFHFYEAAELLGDLAVSLGDYEGAGRYYSAIGKAPWPDYQMRGGILEGRALLAQDKFAEAQAKFDAVSAMGVDTPSAIMQKRFAEVGKASCMAELGKHEEAIVILNKIVAENEPNEAKELFGRANNALGRCHLKAKRDKDALLAYLQVDLLFNAEPEVHAEALYNLSKLLADANKAERAAGARNLLTTRYAGSPWAKRK